jgi:YVTN family beta-propeller protein
MRFAVLGPLAVSGDHGPLALGGPKQRTLLAMLLLEPNMVVSRYRLIEALWPEGVPPSAAESLDAYVYRLRKQLGHDRLVRRDGGYMLRVDAGERDTDDLQRLLASAARASDSGDRAAAVEALSAALALWRGPAWADVLDLPPANAEAQRLGDQRLEALESRLEIELAVGRGPELVPELERLVSEYPLRERLVHSMMLALYRAGRQADALEAFGSARSRLVNELGLEPGPELHELQQLILQHDPDLGTRRRAVPMLASRSGPMLAIIAAIAAAVFGAVIVLTGGEPRRHPALPAGRSGAVAVAVTSGGPGVSLATVLPGTPSGVTTGSGSVWVTDASNGTVSRIDPTSGVQVDRINVGGDPASITSGAGAIWVANADGATVLRIDPTTGMVTQTIPLGGANLAALTFGAGRLWVADSTTRMLYELDPATGHVLPSIPLDVSPAAITFGSGRLWVAGYDRATVLSLDPSSRRVVGRVHVGTGPSSLAFAAGDLWVANRLDSTVSRIDPRRLEVRATIPVGSGPAAITSVADSVWVANQYSGTLSRLDPQRDTVTTTLPVGGQPVSLTSDGALWVGVQGGASSHRGGTLRLASAASYRSIDPAFFFGTEPPQFDGIVYDTLVTFDHTGGAAGLHLVPDLALTLPTPTDAGRTFTFHLRPGIRYSNGISVRADDFRRAIERLFRARAPGTDFYTDIVGLGRV